MFVFEDLCFMWAVGHRNFSQGIKKRIALLNKSLYLFKYIHTYTYIDTAAQKFGIGKIFNVFKGVSSAYLFDQKYRKNSNILKSYCNF